MRLTDLFRTESQQISEANRIPQTTPARTDQINQQIRALTPGQTLQGEVVGRNGQEVQIRVDGDLVLNAKMDQNMNLEVGKNMTFEVKNNGSSLTLSPLFTNTATDANIMKALDMASLPINETTITMTEQMMSAGLSVDKGSLQQMFREMNLFPKAESADIVDLHRLAMPVNEQNVNQMISYRNLTHQLVSGMTNVLDELPQTFSALLTEGKVDDAATLYQTLSKLADASWEEQTTEGTSALEILQTDGARADALTQGVEDNEANLSEEQTIPAQAKESGSGLQIEVLPGEGQTASALQTKNDAAAVKIIVDDTLLSGESAVRETTQEEAIEGAGQQIAPAGQEGTTEDAGALSAQNEAAKEQLISGEMSNETAQLQTMIQELSEHPEAVFEKLSAQGLSEKSLQTLLQPLSERLMENWTIRPEDVEDGKKVEELYRRLDTQLKGMAKALENAGQTESAGYKAVNNLSQNLDFMQQINQMYAYVQLPLKLQQGNAHGDLYVYTNKKNLAMKDGNISALLHLDMEHLGPVDVYVAMQNGEKVNTKFYVQDDEMLDFLEAHMDLLTARLQKRGYDCSFDMQVRSKEQAKENGLESLLDQDNHIPLVDYAFDVRT